MTEKEVREKLRTYICAELLNNPDYSLRDDEPLITSGLMDSFLLAQVGVFAEIQFNVYVPDTDLTVADMDTVDQIVARIMKDVSA